MRSDGRTILIGSAVVALAWLALRGVPGLRSWVDRAETEVEREHLLLARAMREAEGLVALGDSIRRAELVIEELPTLLLAGAEPQTAAFDLTRRLTTLMSRIPAWVDRIEPEADDRRAGPLSAAAVRAHLETDVIGLVEVLRAIGADPALSTQAFGAQATEPAAPADTIERLSVELTVSGWFRVAPPTDGPAVDGAVPDSIVGGGAI